MHDKPFSRASRRGAACRATARGGVRRYAGVPLLTQTRRWRPYDPAVYVSAVPNYEVGETFLLSRGEEFRILAIDTDIDDELIDRGFNSVWTVEPAV